MNPLTWLKTVFTNYHRGRIARDDYDRLLFQGKTVAELPKRPVLYLNAFDLGNRVRFIFFRQWIETGFYEDPGWQNTLGGPQQLTSADDLVVSRLDPKTVRLADAVYASSAFPFAYPNLALKHFGSKIPYQGNLLFLADGGLADNSGLLTLLTQMRIEVEASRTARAVLAILIDASVEALSHGTIFQRQGTEAGHAWRDTYLGHGRAAVEAAIAHHEGTVFTFLEETGVLVDDLIANYETRLVENPPAPDGGGRASWSDAVSSGRLLLRPLVIGLRLRDIDEAYYAVWQSQTNGGPKDTRLVKLFEASGIPSGFERGPTSPWPATTYQELERRLSHIKTDFVLAERARRVLDLAAYLLVHGKLEPALGRWNKVASRRFANR